MAKGIIYIMETAVPGLLKIGKTGSDSFENRMYYLENNGYRNVTALKRVFAIEVEEYDEKEKLLHVIFEKSRVSDTELFSLDLNIAKQLLSSFEGRVIYPKSESKSEIFDEAYDNSKSKLIPNGIYHFRHFKKSDDKYVDAKVKIDKGVWKLLKGSIIGIVEDVGVSKNVKSFRLTMNFNDQGELLEDTDLGQCTPSFAGVIVMNASCNGWVEWKNENGQPVDVYRK